MRIALAQLNPTVADVQGNTAQVLDAITDARAQKADLLVTPEMMLLGYPPRDLLFREGAVEAAEAALPRIAEAASELTAIVGHPRRDDSEVRTIRNSASVCTRGEILATYDKRLLPGYDVFDEDRYFDPGAANCIVDVNGTTIGILICEDLWRAGDVFTNRVYRVDPPRELADAGCDLLIALNATPFIQGKFQRHIDQLREIARQVSRPIVAVNQVGGNDDLVFDGRSVVVDAQGQVVAALSGWESAVQVVDLDAARTDVTPDIFPMRELFHALRLGVRDYCRKTRHADVCIGLSGGIDSALTATIAAAALGGEHVHGVMMPSRYSSAGSISDARGLAENLGLARCDEVAITAMHETARKALLPMLDAQLDGVPDENVQSRLRGVIIMAYANTLGALTLATGNKSELSVGYATLYGDMAGALAVIGDVVKTKVYELSRWINENHATCGFTCPPIPEASITKPPSAELRPDQVDEDSLPPYEVLDEIIDRWIDREQSVDRIIAETGFDPATVRRFTRLIDISQYKRDQAACVIKVSHRAYGRGRPMPLVHHCTRIDASGAS